MDGILGTSVILRESFKAGSEVQSFIGQADEVILHLRFGGGVRKAKKDHPGTPYSRVLALYHKFPELQEKKASLFVPSIMVSEEVLENDFLRSWPAADVYLECDRSHDIFMTQKLVTKILSSRPAIKIGLVINVISGEAAAWMDFCKELSLSKQVFLCPIVGDGVVSLGERLQQLSEEMPGSVPFFLAMSDDEKANLPELLARHSDSIAQVIFGNPQLMRGIDLREVQMTRKSKKNVTIQYEVPSLPATPYRARHAVALRETPSRAAKVRGVVEVDKTYSVVIEKDGTMGLRFGQLDTGLWVILSENGVPYFEKETIQ